MQSNMENEKLKILNRLVKDGSIDLKEVLILLEKQEVVNIPFVQKYTTPFVDWQWKPETSPFYTPTTDWQWRPTCVTVPNGTGNLTSGSTTTNVVYDTAFKSN